MIRIGIDLGGTNIAVGAVNERHEIIARCSVPTGAERPAQAVIADMCAAVEEALRRAGLTAADCASIGIGSPGTCDPETGVVARAYNLGWKDVPVCRMLTEHFGLPAHLGNDANCAALAEVVAGAAAGRRDVVLITLGTGVGGGIVTDGKIYTGFNGLAAELGHFVIQKDGVPCGCGRRGCFEAYASATALIRMTKEELDRCFVSGEGTLMAESRKLNARVAFDAYRAGDAAAKRVIETYIGYLASGIASLINIFQPEVFIIGGGVSNEKQFLLDLLLPRIDAEDFAKNAKKRTRVVIATCGNDAGIIGAAMNE